MTRKFTTRFLLLILLSGSIAAGADPVDESQEPPIKYTIQLGDKSIPIEEGKDTPIQGTFTNPSVKLMADPFREFTYQGVRFKYPRGFTFEADFEEADAKNWTLSGNDFKLMLFSMKGKVSSGAFAEEMMGQFGRQNCKVLNSKATLPLKDQTLNGITFRASIVGHALMLDIYEIPAKGGRSKLIVLQDSIDAAGKHSKEGADTIETLKTSLKLKH